MLHLRHLQKDKGVPMSSEIRDRIKTRLCDAKDHETCTQRKNLLVLSSISEMLGNKDDDGTMSRSAKRSSSRWTSLLTLLTVSASRLDSEQMKPFQLLTRYLRPDLCDNFVLSRPLTQSRSGDTEWRTTPWKFPERLRHGHLIKSATTAVTRTITETTSLLDCSTVH